MESDQVAPQLVVVVLGRPASGKTTLVRQLSERVTLPVIAKDDIKELLFESLGGRDRAWSRKLGISAFALLDYCIERQLQAGASFIIEAAYDAAFENEKFQRWQQRYGFHCLQVHCTARPETLVTRFRARAASTDRHAGHADPESIDEFRRSLRDGRREVLDLDGEVIEIDTETESPRQGAQRVAGRIADAGMARTEGNDGGTER